jgi:hypothetical protein
MIPLLALMLPALALLLPLPLLFRRESMVVFPPSVLMLPLSLVVMVPALVEAEVGRRPLLTVPLLDLIEPLVVVELLVPTLVRVLLALLEVLLELDDVLGTVTLLLEGQCVAPLLRVTLPLVLAALVVPAGRRPDVAVPEPLVLVVLLSLRRVVVVA